MLAKVLVVDDSRVTREIAKVYLMTLGVEVVEADNGEDALKRIREERPALVVADLRMPKLDGPGLCSAVRNDPAVADIPIVIMTSSFTADHVRVCLAAGAREVLAKPANLNALSSAVRRYIRKERS